MASFEDFEKIQRGSTPSRLLDSHPDGRHVALQTDRGSESAVWEKETKRIVWAPSYAIALSWLKNGTQIAGLFEPEDSTYEFAIFSWPEKHLLHTCPVLLSMEMGRFFGFRISPSETVALCRWIDQTEFGFECVDITQQGVKQDIPAAYFFEGTNDVSQPAFSPNGQMWACCYKMDEVWWATDPEDPDPEQPARGGEYTIGAMLIFQGKQKPPRTIPLIATIPSGWLPKDPFAEEVLMIADPFFLDDHRIQIQLPSGEVQIHPL